MKSKKNVMVCVTQQKTCERLIKRGAKLRDSENGELYVIHVARNEWNFLDSSKESEALEYLFSISKSVEADLSVLKSDNIVKSIIDFASDKNISFIILGESTQEEKDKEKKGKQKGNKLINQLKQTLSGVEIIIMPAEESAGIV